MEPKSTSNPDENRRLLEALAASLRPLDSRAARTLKENAHHTNITLLIDVLTLIERRRGLPVEIFKLVALAKKAIVSGKYDEYWIEHQVAEGLRPPPRKGTLYEP